MSTANVPKTIHMRHDQIIVACYEWAARRGFRPTSAGEMMLAADHLQHGEQGSIRFTMSFPCDSPCGEACWDNHGKLFPFVSRKDVPWFDNE